MCSRACVGGGRRGVQVLHAAATLAHEFLVDKDRAAPRALLDTAVYLHEIMLSLQGLQGIALQNVMYVGGVGLGVGCGEFGYCSFIRRANH